MLVALARFLNFTLQWMHGALGQEPKGQIYWLNLAVGLVMAEMSLCTAGLVASNSCAWIFGLIVGVMGLNAIAASIAWQVLFGLLPKLQAQLPGLRIGGQLSFLATEVIFASWAILGLAVLVLGVFLPLSYARLRDGAFAWSLIPGIPLGTWIGNTSFPTLSTMAIDAADVLPNPVLEAVELCIGWTLCIGLILSDSCNLAPPSGGVVSAAAIGRALKPARHGSVQ
eukprot:CAMPEP_0197705070 /NCGR_PEP_ID=MMETSP1338-20131121/126257_1 /TAXON_ID=43686 ORGANISM="Pelagodinium beii, Strain RCC1491" /NCGR_SAMPLE_ID=MMETSP1338 /ASSEMBLY_ACC=CAM_ASM_000754 /LENGTH=225 /DNA_ID=CAMNT_0043288975 /DNA_START=457 /DNA_END=1134 /DNA_ORIENTATION=+